METKFQHRFFDQAPKPGSDQENHLAYTSPVFDNIGVLCVELELLNGIAVSNSCGSAVYLGGQFLITAAHCIQKTREIIENLDESLIKVKGFTFKLINQNGSISSEYKVEVESIHPQYKPANYGPQHPCYDLALLKLASKPDHLAGLQLIAQSNIEHVSDCTAVGFGMKGERDGWFMSRDGLKRAMPISDVSIIDTGYYCHINGYKLIKSDTVYCEKIEDELQKSGVSLGMSGGALINGANQLLGITSHFFTPGDHLFGESNPLETEQFKQSKWLRNKFSEISAVISYISPLPVLGLNPLTGMADSWININSDLYRDWLLKTMELNSTPEEFSELAQFHGLEIFQENECNRI